MFVVVCTLRMYIYVFMSCSISYSLYDTLIVPWNVCMYMYVCVCVCVCVVTLSFQALLPENFQGMNSKFLWEQTWSRILLSPQ